MSRLFVIGLNHRTAPVEVREALSEGRSGELLREELRQAASIAQEAMLLLTCNRCELYGRLPEGAGDELLERAAALLVRPRPGAATALYRHVGEPAVRHLFRVAASLDSMVLGEPQILGQVKAAYRDAEAAGTIGTLLSGTVPRAFTVAKRVRSETEIGQTPSSVASVAVGLASQVFGSLKGHPVLLVGAGKMAELCARHLREAGADRFLVCNRTRGRAEELAKKLGGSAHELAELESLLGKAAVVITSAGAPEPLVRAEVVSRVMRARRGRWLLFVDIAVPRDVEPAVGKLDNVYLYDIDALQGVVAENLKGRASQADAAEQIVAVELQRYLDRQRSADLSPLIRALRGHAISVAQAEVARFLPKLQLPSERERRLVAQLADGIVNKLLHGPLTELKRAATQADGGGGELAEAVRRLWSLDESKAPELIADPESLPVAVPEPASAPPLRKPEPSL